ncbi:hypothetical protein HDV00_008085 [Rhizophlyctis rosea]|nr:hypothetical protein HDV00_008085 [Rhizophlyctis rosea]
MAEERLQGVFNFTNPGAISHNEVLALYKKWIDPNFTWKNFSLEEQSNVIKAGRSNCKLDTTKLEKTLQEMGIYIPEIYSAYEQCFQRMAVNMRIGQVPDIGDDLNFAIATDCGERLSETRYDHQVIMVTGGAGFIGSYAVRKMVLLYPEYTIVNFDKIDYCSSLNNIRILEGRPNYVFVKGDIMDADQVLHVLRSKKVNTIIHFAAQSHVDNSFGNSAQFTGTNVMGTHILLEAAKEMKITKFIHVSTDEVYGEVESASPDLPEESILAPTNPYAATKAAAEMLVHAYHKSFGLPTIITRSNNVYGPYQYPEKVIPKFILRLDEGKKCCLHGDGSNTRRYIYGSDVADAIVLVLHKGTIGEIYNIGTETELSNLEVAKRLIKTMNLPGDPADHLEYVPDRPFNDKRYAVDSTKLQQLGWSAKVSFEEGLQRTRLSHICQSISSKDAQSAVTLPDDPVAAKPADTIKLAYSTYITNEEYVCPALQMIWSLLKAGQREDIPVIAMVTEGVGEAPRKKMEAAGYTIMPVDSIMTQFDRIIALDVDGYIFKSLDYLFDYPPHPVYAPRAYWLTKDLFTSILYIIEPSETLFKMQEDVWQKAENESRPLFDMNVSNDALVHMIAILPGGINAIDTHLKPAPEEQSLVHPLWTIDDWAKNVAYVHYSEAPQGGYGKPWRGERKINQPANAHPMYKQLVENYWALEAQLCK